MILGLAVSVLLAASDPSSGDEADCIWNALPLTRREALPDFQYRGGLDYGLDLVRKAVPAAEVAAAAQSCGGDFEQGSLVGYMAIQAAAGRKGAEAALAAGYSPEALDRAFEPLRDDLETFQGTPPGDEPGAGSDPKDLFKRFLAKLGGTPSASDRVSLARYFQARVYGVLAEEVWRTALAEQAAEKAEEERRVGDLAFVQRDSRPAWERDSPLTCYWRSIPDSERILYDLGGIGAARAEILSDPNLDDKLRACGADLAAVGKVEPLMAVRYAERRLIRRYTAAHLDETYRNLWKRDRTILQQADIGEPAADDALGRFQAALGLNRSADQDEVGMMLDLYAQYRARLDD